MLAKFSVYLALRTWLALLGVHSIVLGIVVYFFAQPFLTSQGFDLSGGLFYPHQSGAFLVILGVGYALAALDPKGRQALVFLSVFSKAVAVVFLSVEIAVFQAPASATLAGALDAFLGAVLLILAIAYYRQREEDNARSPRYGTIDSSSCLNLKEGSGTG